MSQGYSSGSLTPGTLSVGGGGTGRTTQTAYAVLCGGTTTTAAQQSIASVGTTGQVLTSNGAAALPTFQAAGAGGGGNVFLASATASASASLTFATGIDATYNCYMFVLDNLLMASASTFFRFRTSTNGGSSYDTGLSDYSYNVWYQAGTGAVSYIQDDADSKINIIKAQGNSANNGLSGILYLVNPSGTGYTQCLFSTRGTANTGDQHMTTGSGTRLSAADVDAVQFVNSSGNIASGTISMYGMTTPS